MKSASRNAPVSGSLDMCTIVLNCLPRRVLSRKLPCGTSVTTGATGMKCALPSAVAKLPPSQRREPPHWIASPVACRRSTPAYDGTTRAISSRISWPESNATRCARSGSTRRARSTKISHSLRASPDLVSGDLRAEGDPPLGGGLGSAVALLVAGGGGQQHDDVARVDEHLARHDDVLVHPQGHPARARASTSSGSGSTSRKFPPDE